MIRQKLMQFMYGRYGVDAFSFALMILSFLLQFIFMFFSGKLFFLRVLAYIPLYYAVFRTLSKNIEKRRAENDWFLKVTSKFRRKQGSFNPYNSNYSSYSYDYAQTEKKQKIKKDTKNFKYFKCANCKAQLRVPKGKGKLTITCPKCKNTFKGKS